jgi:nitrile hydratase
MNGVHDMGGQQNMGPVVYEKNEPVFHAPWEGRIYALNRAIRAWRKWNPERRIRAHRRPIQR